MSDEDVMEGVGLNYDCLSLVFQYLNCCELMKVCTISKLWNSVGSFTLRTKSHFSISSFGQNAISEERLINILKENNGNFKYLDLCHKHDNMDGHIMEVTSIGIAEAIKDHCPNLRRLKVRSVLRLSSHLSLFSNMANLTEICIKLGDSVPVVFNNTMPFLMKLRIGRWQRGRESFLFNFNDSLAMTPNLTHLCLYGITLGADFNRIASSCPNLEVVNVPFCGYGRGIASFLPLLKGLNLIELNYRMFDRNEWEYYYPLEDHRIDVAVECLVDFKKLEFLNITVLGSDLNNSHVVRLIIQLPQLRHLVFYFGRNVDEELVPLLNAHPEVKERKLQAVQVTCKKTPRKSITIVDSKIQVYFGKNGCLPKKW